MKSAIKILLLITVVFAIALSGQSTASTGTTVPTKKGKPVPAVEVAKVQKVVLVNELNTTGNVSAENSVVIKAMVEGPIKFCPWKEGDKIKANEKLVEIERPLYAQEVRLAEAAFKVAKAKLADLEAGTRKEEIAQARQVVKQREEAAEFAKSDFERIESLVNTGALPAEASEKARVAHIKCQTDLIAAKEKLEMLIAGPTRTLIEVQRAAVAEAEAKLGIAQAKFNECVILAPFSGIISKVLIREGDLATPRTALIEMYDPNSIVVRFAVPEKSSAKIKQGFEVEVMLDAYPEAAYKGIVSKIFPELAKDSRSRLVEARVKDGPELIPGMFARITTRFDSNECLAIPDSAILSNVRGENITFVAVENKAVLRKIKTGLEYNNLVEIISGLKDGENVITNGNRSVKDGSEIKILGKTLTTSEKSGEPK
jgi:multidrug efflux pump subunit AcrA (membrane-fusion protein)